MILRDFKKNRCCMFCEFVSLPIPELCLPKIPKKEVQSNWSTGVLLIQLKESQRLLQLRTPNLSVSKKPAYYDSSYFYRRAAGCAER